MAIKFRYYIFAGMELKKLRVGNYFYEIDRSNEVHLPVLVPLEVVSIEIDKIKRIIQGTNLQGYRRVLDTKHYNVTHIPLCEGWYNTFGYECLQELIVDMIDKSKYPISHDIALWAKVIPGLHVHQLQNLYFALTEVELKAE